MTIGWAACASALLLGDNHCQAMMMMMAMTMAMAYYQGYDEPQSSDGNNDGCDHRTGG